MRENNGDQLVRCITSTATAIWGNSLSNERKLVYETGFNGKGVIRKLSDEEMQTVPAVEASPSEPLPESSAEGVPTRQGTLFDDIT